MIHMVSCDGFFDDVHPIWNVLKGECSKAKMANVSSPNATVSSRHMRYLSMTPNLMR